MGPLCHRCWCPPTAHLGEWCCGGTESMQDPVKGVQNAAPVVPWRHAGATFLAFVAAGSVPLVPYMAPAWEGAAFRWSVVATLASLFAVGALRATVTIERWWAAGLEMLTLGTVVAAAAYAAGAIISSLVS